jgi:hypothetical protein
MKITEDVRKYAAEQPAGSLGRGSTALPNQR